MEVWSRATTPPLQNESTEVENASVWRFYENILQGRDAGERPITHWRDYISISSPAWGHLIVPQEELESGAGKREVWVSFLDYCICDSTTNTW